MFPQKAIINYLFPKDPGIVRVRKSEEVKTAVNNVTTMDFIDLVERYDYSAEEHYVTTEDGYILTIHRISASPLCKGRQKRGVIFFQNGILASSDFWVLTGPDKDLAFLLADEGYDIWLGNYRGNTYCRSHIKLSSRLQVKLGVCFAPIAMSNEMPTLVEYLHTYNEFFESNEIYEIASLSSTTITLARTLCADKTITQAACIALIFLIVGSDPAQLNTVCYQLNTILLIATANCHCFTFFKNYKILYVSLPEILSYYPVGTSMQLLIHYYQNFVTKKFQTFDYGYFGNYKQYGQMTPITYDLNKVTAPLALFYGANDVLVPVANVWETYKRLPNVILLEEIAYKLFSHADFLIAIDVKTLMYDRVIELFQKIDNN
ncbi:LIP3 Lipase, partial [Acromyrmex insinuator]